MAPILRKKHILEALAEHGMLGISELAAGLDVSEMTVRRDISKLEQQGLVLKHHGVVELAEHATLGSLSKEPSRDQKHSQHHQEKACIAQLAISEIEEGMSIFLDAGTTTMEIARLLTREFRFDDLTVITNDFAITELLMKHSHYKLYHTGGRVDSRNESCVGEQTARMLADLHIGKAFISSSSWDLQGLTTPNEAKLAVKRTLAANSGNAYLVCDSSKFNREAMFRVFGLDQFDKVFTDADLPEDALEQIRKQGVEVVQSQPMAVI